VIQVSEKQEKKHTPPTCDITCFLMKDQFNARAEFINHPRLPRRSRGNEENSLLIVQN